MEITKEQKEAIEFIKDLIAWDVRQDLCPNKEECETLETILNLIEKLQKENEELNKENEHLHREINRRIKLKIENEKIVDTQFIYKQKIKDKIKELNSRIEKYREYAEQGIETDIEWVDNVADRETVEVLQELLEESE